MDPRHNRLSILMFPWLAHGHISPFLQLAKNLTKRNFHIYYCSTPVKLTSVKEKLSPKYSHSIQLVELHLPSSAELPPHYHTTKGLPPHLMPTLKTALDMAAPAFSNIVKTLNPDLLIYDFLQPWAQEIASAHTIPAVLLFCPGAATCSFLLHTYQNSGYHDFPFPSIYLTEYQAVELDAFLESSANGVKDMNRYVDSINRSSDIILIKSFLEFEGKYIDYLSVLTGKRVVPVGTLVADPSEEEEGRNIIEWLDKKDHASTVFVSFGTEYFLSKEEREAVAYGLEHSNVSFVWVVRFHGEQRTRVEEALPTGFLERVGERGMVVDGWAPQLRILRHGSIGGFVSHCGWSSVMESVKFGVPIIAVPMHLDQPLNAKVVEEVVAGVEVKRKEDGRLDGEELAKVIREVLVGESGDGVRTKTREMSEKLKNRGDEEIDEVVEELMQLVKMRTFNS